MTLNPSSLSDSERRTYLVAAAYEEERKKRQFGYRFLEDLTPELLESSQWKTFHTVTQWLVGKGWDIMLKQEHWKGYVKSVFDYFKPVMPMPGQLRNDRLLRSYLKGTLSLHPTRRSDADLDALYNRILRPDVARLPYIRRRLYLDTPDA